jgi:glycosyltransferase involved in cell wall biosynthesis
MVPAFKRGRVLKSFGTAWIHRVVTVSENNRGYLMREHHVPARKIRVVPIGIPDPETARVSGIRGDLGVAGSEILIAAVGALDGRKGTDSAIRAVAKLPGSYHLAVAGEGPKSDEYRGLAAALDVAGRVHFLGHREDIAAILRSCDLLVHPSEIDATPYVVIEAMAAGVPVIASGIYGIPELVADGETGLLVEPGDPTGLARSVEALCADPQRMAVMGRRGRKRYEDEFTIERSVSNTIAVYEELLPPRQARRRDQA